MWVEELYFLYTGEKTILQPTINYKLTLNWLIRTCWIEVLEAKWKENKTEYMPFAVTWIGLTLSASYSRSMHVLHKQKCKSILLSHIKQQSPHYDKSSVFITAMELPQ